MIAIAEVKMVMPRGGPALGHHGDHEGHASRGRDDDDDAMSPSPSRRWRRSSRRWQPTTSDRQSRRASAALSSPSTRRRATSTTPRSRSATRATRSGTCTRPFPVHGMDKAMGLKDSARRLDRPSPMGLTGCISGFLMMWWMNGIDYPLVIGGKPGYSLPSMIAGHVRADRPALRVRRGVRDARHQPAPEALAPRLLLGPLRAGDSDGPFLHLHRGRGPESFDLEETKQLLESHASARTSSSSKKRRWTQ